MSAIYVFKTSVLKSDLVMLSPILNKILPDAKWNFDLEDCDNILRIDSKSNIAELVIECMLDNGFECVELE